MRRLSYVLVVAAAGLALSAPAALAAGKSGQHHCAPPDTSAVNIYTDQVPTSCGSQTVDKKPAKKPTTSQSSSTPSSSYNSTPSVPLQQAAVKPLQKAKPKVRKLLKRVATDTNLGNSRPIHFVRTSASRDALSKQAAPTAVGAAFDLGSGPTALFAVLLAAAALLALGGGIRRGRR